MKLILARHGNTFAAGETPVWVGAAEDYPLVPRGLEQAEEVAEALIRCNLKPSLILAGPLRRTRQGAEIIADKTGYQGDIRIDARLTEINYGSWGGRSDAEIEADYGAEVIEAWRDRSIRPPEADWSPDDAVLMANARDVLHELLSMPSNTVVLLVSSNGILRFYHSHLYAGQETAPSGKVRTGHLCFAVCRDSQFDPRMWNVAPQDFIV